MGADRGQSGGPQRPARAGRAGTEASGKARSTLAELETLVERLERVIDQTRLRLAGQTPPGATRLVSLHDPDARPIMKGRIGKPVEFGYLAQVVDNADGIVADHSIHVGNPSDGPLLAPAIERIGKKLVGRAPTAVTADRGYGEANVQARLEALGVKTVAIVRKGRQSAARRSIEGRPRFRTLIKWRTGCEGRISALKRGHGWSRSLTDGIGGTQTWCGYGIFANNSVKISGLIAAEKNRGSLHESLERRRPFSSQTATATSGITTNTAAVRLSPGPWAPRRALSVPGAGRQRSEPQRDQGQNGTPPFPAGRPANISDTSPPISPGSS